MDRFKDLGRNKGWGGIRRKGKRISFGYKGFPKIREGGMSKGIGMTVRDRPREFHKELKKRVAGKRRV